MTDQLLDSSLTLILRFFKMLGVFRSYVNKPDPTEPEWPGPEYVPALKDWYLQKHFASVYPFSAIVNLGDYGFLAYSADNKISPGPRPIFGMMDGIYCLYKGCVEKLQKLKMEGQERDGADLIITTYRRIKKKANKTPSDIMKNLSDDHNYILFDRFGPEEGDMRGAFAANDLKNVPLFSGFDLEGSSVISDDVNIMKKVCGKSFKRIPKGNGLRIPILAGDEDQEDDDFDEFYGNDAGLLASAVHDEEDKKDDAVWAEIDFRMASRKTAKREARMKEQMEKQRATKPSISEQFADVSRELHKMTREDWENIPEVGGDEENGG